VRVDSGIAAGVAASVHYDPILAKIITSGENREEARRKMVRALAETVILGVRTPLDYLRAVLEHPAFVAGETHTGFIPEHLADWAPAPASEEERRLAALTAALVQMQHRPAPGPGSEGATPTPWQTLGGWDNG
jgi:acetyl/propionyl-CoA carboxylase alpha subunit